MSPLSQLPNSSTSTSVHQPSCVCNSRTYFDLFFSLLYFSESLHLLNNNCHLCSLGSRCDNKDKVAKDLLQVILEKQRVKGGNRQGKPSDHSVGLAPMKRRAGGDWRKELRLQCKLPEVRHLTMQSIHRLAEQSIADRQIFAMISVAAEAAWEEGGFKHCGRSSRRCNQGSLTALLTDEGDLLLQARSKQSLYSLPHSLLVYFKKSFL